MKTEIETDIYDIIADCPQSNGQYAADGIDIGEAAKKVVEYIEANFILIKKTDRNEK